MTQDSAQTPSGRNDAQPNGQQAHAEGEHTASAEHAPQDFSESSGTGTQASGAAASSQANALSRNPLSLMAAAGKVVSGLLGNKNGDGSAHTASQSGTDKTEAVPEPSPKGIADKIFNTLSYAGLFFLLLIMLAQAWPALLGHNLYCPCEAESILTYHQCLSENLWLAPSSAETAQWPFFFWLLRGIDTLLSQAAPQLGYLLFPLATLLGAFLALVATWTFSRVSGMNRPAALAGGMLLLCAPLFAPISGFLGPESLAVALTLFSLSCLSYGWRQNRAFVLLPLGFIFAVLAGLAGGLFFLLLPVIASIFFLLWLGSFRRAQALDGVLGFVIMLALLGCWLGSVILWQQPDGYLKYLGAHLVNWPLTADQWWKHLLMAGLGLLPWLAIVLCVSWTRVLRTAMSDLSASRNEKAGMAFLWISLAFACLLGIPVYGSLGPALCIVCLAAPLLGKALLRLSSVGSKLFYIIAALCLLHAGMALLAASFGFSLEWLGKLFRFTLTEDQRVAILSLKALPVLGAICIAAAILLARLVRRGNHGGTRGALILCTCVAVVLAQPITLMLVPQLGQLPYAQVKTLNAILAPATPEITPAEKIPTPAPTGLPALEVTPVEPDVPSDTLAPTDSMTIPETLQRPALPTPPTSSLETPAQTTPKAASGETASENTTDLPPQSSVPEILPVAPPAPQQSTATP